LKPSTDRTRSPFDARTSRLRLWTCALVLTTALTPCAPAFAAAPKGKVVQALIAAAQKEFEAGNFDRAGELFVEIWRQDPDSRPALYNAARAYQLGGKLDRADELYRELLAIPDLDPALKTKAQAQLDILQGQRGERKADEADRAEKAGQYAAAAGLWGDAVRLVPAKLPWLLRWARALQMAGQWAAAEAAYDRYLAATPTTSEDRAQVSAWREEVELKLHPPAVPTPPVEPAPTPKPVEVAPTPTPVTPVQPRVGVVKREAPPPASKLPMVVLGGGGALAVAGIVTLLIAKGEEADLQAKFATDKKITTITRAASLAEADRISSHYAIGWALTGVGVVGAGVGAWLLATQPATRVTVAPTLDGVLVSGRF
jgi:tetratricopeptide (TPR) repeat protein